MEAAIERQTMKQVYSRLLPFCFLLYFICYLDRVNIGFAALTRWRPRHRRMEMVVLLRGATRSDLRDRDVFLSDGPAGAGKLARARRTGMVGDGDGEGA